MTAAELIVAGLAAVGLALRLRLIGQGLWSDELLAYRDIHGNSFRETMRIVAEGHENSPPVYFVLAWLSSKLGSDPALLRLPSLVLGTAAIPVVFMIGVRTVGRWAGVMAAGFIALSPFTIHYTVEARPYAVLMFCSALSVFLLLVALERDGTGWWGAWGLSLAAVLYTHYTGFAVVGVQVAWALWARPAARREVCLAAALAAIAFMPWLPYVKGERLDVYEQIVSTLGISYPDAAISWLTGLPLVAPGDLPGWPALAFFAGGLGLALALAARPAATVSPLAGAARSPLATPGPALRDWRSPAALVVLLAVATPLAVLAYSLLFHELFRFPRNLIASLPFAALVIGWVLTRPGWPRAAVPLALATAGLAIGTVKSEQDRWSRPDFPEAADFIDAAAGPRDRVVYSGAGLEGYSLAQALRPYLTERHRSEFTDDPERWAGAPRVVVVTAGPTGEPAPALPAARGLAKVEERELPGLSSLRVALYRAQP